MKLKSLKELKFLLNIYDMKEGTIKEIQKVGGLSQDKTYKMIKVLLDEGVLEKTDRVRFTSRMSLIYRINKKVIRQILLAEEFTKKLHKMSLSDLTVKPRNKNIY